MTDHPDDKIEEKYRNDMRDIAGFLDSIFNPGKRGGDRDVGFVLMVFPIGEMGRFNYVSNADRKSIVTLMREMIARFEGQPEIKPGNA